MNPGPTPVILNPSPTAVFIGELTRTHTENMRVFRKYKNVDVACKKIITNLVGEVYYRTLKILYTGYATQSCLEVISHLWTEYGNLTELEVQAND